MRARRIGGGPGRPFCPVARERVPHARSQRHGINCGGSPHPSPDGSERGGPGPCLLRRAVRAAALASGGSKGVGWPQRFPAGWEPARPGRRSAHAPGGIVAVIVAAPRCLWISVGRREGITTGTPAWSDRLRSQCRRKARGQGPRPSGQGAAGPFTMRQRAPAPPEVPGGAAAPEALGPTSNPLDDPRHGPARRAGLGDASGRNRASGRLTATRRPRGMVAMVSAGQGPRSRHPERGFYGEGWADRSVDTAERSARCSDHVRTRGGTVGAAKDGDVPTHTGSGGPCHSGACCPVDPSGDAEGLDPER